MRQEDVADYLDLAKTTYAAYEQGAAQADYETLKRLSRLYGVTINQLLEKDAPSGYLLSDEQCRILAGVAREMRELADGIGMIDPDARTPKRQSGGKAGKKEDGEK